MYLVHRVKIINIRTSVTMKVLKLDDKVKAINICDGGNVVGPRRWVMVVPDNQNSFKKCEILTILKTMFPVQENVNIV